MSAFDKLIDAYGRIAETLPRLEKYSEAFSDNSAFLGKMALYYADILEFHRRAYKFVRRKCKSDQSEERLGAIQNSMQLASDVDFETTHMASPLYGSYGIGIYHRS